MHAAFGEGALGGFDFELEPERVDGCRSGGQLAFCFARQDTAVQQSSVWCLGRVIASGDARAAADLLGEFAHRVQEVHIVASQLVDSLQGGQSGRFKALVANQASHDRPVLLLDLCRFWDYADQPEVAVGLACVDGRSSRHNPSAPLMLR
jgi:hypothetical protein